MAWPEATTSTGYYEIICSNCRLDGVTLAPPMRKPVDLLVEGLETKPSRGNGVPDQNFFAAPVEAWGKDTKRLLMAA